MNRVTFQDGKKTFRVHKILDDLEYVAQNMGGGTGGSGSSSTAAAMSAAAPPTPPKKQLEASPAGSKTKGAESPPAKPGAGGGGGGGREKEISELKALVTRLTKNNQEMLGLLTERVRHCFMLILLQRFD